MIQNTEDRTVGRTCSTCKQAPRFGTEDLVKDIDLVQTSRRSTENTTQTGSKGRSQQRKRKDSEVSREPRLQGIRSPASSRDFSLISYDSFCISYWTLFVISATTSGENKKEVSPDSQNELGCLHSELGGKPKAFTTH